MFSIVDSVSLSISDKHWSLDPTIEWNTACRHDVTSAIIEHPLGRTLAACLSIINDTGKNFTFCFRKYLLEDEIDTFLETFLDGLGRMFTFARKQDWCMRGEFINIKGFETKPYVTTVDSW